MGTSMPFHGLVHFFLSLAMLMLIYFYLLVFFREIRFVCFVNECKIRQLLFVRSFFSSSLSILLSLFRFLFTLGFHYSCYIPVSSQENRFQLCNMHEPYATIDCCVNERISNAKRLKKKKIRHRHWLWTQTHIQDHETERERGKNAVPSSCVTVAFVVIVTIIIIIAI